MDTLETCGDIGCCLCTNISQHTVLEAITTAMNSVLLLKCVLIVRTNPSTEK